MHFNLFSYVLIIIIIYVVFKNFNKPLETMFKHILMVGLVVSFNTNLGNFFQLGASSVGYMFLINIILATIGVILIITKKNYKFKVLKFGFFTVLSLIIGLIGLKLRPYTGGIIIDYDKYVGGDSTRIYDLTVTGASYRFLINAVCFFIVASSVYNTFTKEDIIKSIKFILNISLAIYLSVFILETIGNYLLHISIAEKVFIPFFGYSHPTSVNIDRYHGLFKETSHYALALFFLSLLCVVDININKQINREKNIRKGIIRFLFFLFLLAISTSFIGIFYLFVSMLLYIAFDAKPKYKKIFCASACFVAVILICIIMTGHGNIIPLYERFEKLFSSFSRLIKGESADFSSEGARLTSMFEMLVLVAARPFFGIGVAAADAHSTILAMLGTTGIIGTGLWIITMLKASNIKRRCWFFIFLLIGALTCSGGNGGLTEIRLLYLFVAIGCVKFKIYGSQNATTLNEKLECKLAFVNFKENNREKNSY